MQTIHKRQELFHLAITCIPPPQLLVGSVLLIFFVFCVVVFFSWGGGCSSSVLYALYFQCSGLSILDCPLVFHQRLFSTLILYWTTTDCDLHKCWTCKIAKPNFNISHFFLLNHHHVFLSCFVHTAKILLTKNKKNAHSDIIFILELLEHLLKLLILNYYFPQFKKKIYAIRDN